jgi:hypothetical protein
MKSTSCLRTDPVCRYYENQKNKRDFRRAFLVKDRRDTKIFPRFFDFSTGYVPLTAMNTIDLTQRPPRSPRVTLGGYVILPRMLDKGRAELAGKAGDYHFNCGLDQRFVGFAGVSSEDILQLLKEGKSDSEILAWIRQHGKRSDFEIASWSQFQLQRCPSDNEGREFLSGTVQKLAPDRDDIQTIFDVLDLDDFVSFGGAA